MLAFEQIMQADRFFQTPRGRIVEALRRRKSASAVDLSKVFGLSPNAIRQQLVVLERDGLVVEQSVRRGPTKPTHEFSLTKDGEKLFPQHYDKMLGAALREVRAQHGETGIAALFELPHNRGAAAPSPTPRDDPRPGRPRPDRHRQLRRGHRVP